MGKKKAHSSCSQVLVLESEESKWGEFLHQFLEYLFPPKLEIKKLNFLLFSILPFPSLSFSPQFGSSKSFFKVPIG